MDGHERWAERVAEWKASGMTSAEFCEGKPFTAGGLRHWAYRLRQTKAREPSSASVRLARVVRIPAPTVVPPHPMAAAIAWTPPPEALFVEVGAMRVAVRPGFDRATLAAVLDVLVTQGGGR